MGERSSGRVRRQAGQATMELALSSIVLLLLLTGLLDLARVFYYDVSLQGAAREGARHAAWFDTVKRANIYLDDADVENAVNTSLNGAGLPSVTGNSGSSSSTCLAGSTFNNPPYADTAYPAITVTNQPLLYVCYTKPDGTQVTSVLSAPTNNAWRMGDVNVSLLMNYGLITFFLQNMLGETGFHVVSNAHFTIQGRP